MHVLTSKIDKTIKNRKTHFSCQKTLKNYKILSIMFRCVKKCSSIGKILPKVLRDFFWEISGNWERNYTSHIRGLQERKKRCIYSISQSFEMRIQLKTLRNCANYLNGNWMRHTQGNSFSLDIVCYFWDTNYLLNIHLFFVPEICFFRHVRTLP